MATSGSSIAVSVAIASLVGTVAGFYPAWLASRLDPAVALASER
jgi:ABC-type antimicrobial peptide transport system permease subunit